MCLSWTELTTGEAPSTCRPVNRVVSSLVQNRSTNLSYNLLKRGKHWSQASCFWYLSGGEPDITRHVLSDQTWIPQMCEKSPTFTLAVLPHCLHLLSRNENGSWCDLDTGVSRSHQLPPYIEPIRYPSRIHLGWSKALAWRPATNTRWATTNESVLFRAVEAEMVSSQ